MNNTFHKRQVHSFVVMIEINPAANTLKEFYPNSGIFQNIRTAEVVEFFHAVGFNLFASGNAELFFSCHFRRKSVAVPPQTTFYFFAIHSLKTRHHVFNIRHHNVSVVWSAVGKRRSVIKHKFCCAVAVMHRLFKSFIFFPELQHFFFKRHKIRLCFHISIVFCHNFLPVKN